jgi:hypothetical protein
VFDGTGRTGPELVAAVDAAVWRFPLDPHLREAAGQIRNMVSKPK